MISVGTKLRLLRKQKHLTLDEVATALNAANPGASFTKGTLSKWENGRQEPMLGALKQVADYYGVNLDYFVSANGINSFQPHDEDYVKRVPVIGTIACGDPIDADENIDEYRMEYFPNGVPSGKLVDLRCKGDSMEPTIPNGSIVVIRLQPEVENGEIAAVLVDGDTRATLKRVKYVAGKVVLWPENPKYDPIWLDDEHPGRIIGKAIQYTAPL